MKSSDVKIGQTYAFATYGSSRRHPASAYNNKSLSPLTVTEIVKESVRTQSYGRRMATFIVGTNVRNGEVRTVRTESKNIVCTWAEVAAARAEEAQWAAKAADTTAQRNAELDPVIARVEQALRDRGYDLRSRHIGMAYIHSVTGEATDKRPKAFDTVVDSGWEYVNLSHESVLDRGEILKNGKITVPVTLLDDLISVSV